MYNTTAPHVWSAALKPLPKSYYYAFNYRIIPVGYWIIIVANIINRQMIDIRTTCFPLVVPFHFTEAKCVG